MKREDYFGNIGGLNITDSPFFIKENQASSGWNYNHTYTGAIQKRLGLLALNSSADAQLRTLGLAVITSASGTQTVIRMGGIKVQTLNPTTGAIANLSEDTATPNSSFFTADTTAPVSSVQFETASSSNLWMIGGGVSSTLYGCISGTTVTQNGVAAPTGTFTAVVTTTGGSFSATGTYYYAVALRKLSTQAVSNAALDQSAAVANLTDKVTLTFPTGVDSTKYDKWYVYRSAVGGVTAFTTGTLVAQVTVGTATYVDLGNVSVATSQTVPRASNTIDNSPLSSITCTALSVFKRRLVVAAGNTFYLSDLNKDESWPSENAITIPTGDRITGSGVIGFNTPTTSTSDETLCIWKPNELWAFTGNDSTDWDLKFVDVAGCPAQSLIARAKGYIFWLNYDGIYMWNGAGKPIKCSRPIEALWESDGDLDKTRITQGVCAYYKKSNQIIWYVSHRTKGAAKIAIKLDLRLTMPSLSTTMAGNEIDGVFTLENTSQALTGAVSYIPASSAEESVLVGDTAGYVYKHYFAANDDDNVIDFNYSTKNFDMGLPGVTKRFRKVVVWVDASIPNDLTLNYWTNYKITNLQKSTISTSMQAENAGNSALWDVALWDISYWDEYTPSIKGVVFNLNSAENNSDGDSLRLQIQQDEADAPTTVYGFSIFWEEMGVRK